MDRVNTPEHQRLALEAAQQSIVLLKNDEKLLPYDDSQLQSMAVVGPNADATRVMLGNYHGHPPYIVRYALLDKTH